MLSPYPRPHIRYLFVSVYPQTHSLALAHVLPYKSNKPKFPIIPCFNFNFERMLYLVAQIKKKVSTVG